MKRTPLKRTAFRSKAPPHREAQQLGNGYTLRPRATACAIEGLVSRMSVPVPKDGPIQNEAYMAAVRKLACDRCGITGFTQFCHADILGRGGKGKSLRSDCRLGWPGCGPRGDEPGCHWYVGTSGRMPKAERHEYEAAAGRRTRAAIRAAGAWPKNLEPWPGDEGEPDGA
jgi:hypothetical protein